MELPIEYWIYAQKYEVKVCLDAYYFEEYKKSTKFNGNYNVLLGFDSDMKNISYINNYVSKLEPNKYYKFCHCVYIGNNFSESTKKRYEYSLKLIEKISNKPQFIKYLSNPNGYFHNYKNSIITNYENKFVDEA